MSKAKHLIEKIKMKARDVCCISNNYVIECSENVFADVKPDEQGLKDNMAIIRVGINIGLGHYQDAVSFIC